MLRQLGQLRSAWVRQPQQFGTLIKGLAGRIVAGLAQQPVIAQAQGFDQHRVTAGDQQGKVRKARGRGFQQGCQQVSLQMVDADRRQAPAMGQGSRQGRPAQQGTDQAGTGRVGHPLQIAGLRRRSLECAAHQGQQALDVVARGQFRDHAAENAV